MKRFKTADDFFDAQERWKSELNQLRTVLLSSGLEETIKWGAPTYTH